MDAGGAPDRVPSRPYLQELEEYCWDLLSNDQDRRRLKRLAERITSTFRRHDVPITQDSMGGFLNGFLLTCIHSETPGPRMQRLETTVMTPVIGAICLTAADIPLACTPAEREAIYDSDFWDLGLNPPLGEKPDPATEQEILEFFRIGTPDVPVNTESLAGLVTGIVYAFQFIDTFTLADWIANTVFTARHMALHCPPEPAATLLTPTLLA
jgi:hypothetical protein